MSRAMMHGTLCLILMTLALISSSNATDLQTAPDSELKSLKTKSIDEPTKASVAYRESVSQSKALNDSATQADPEDKAFEVPLPSAVWLMAGGLLALVLIRRRNR